MKKLTLPLTKEVVRDLRAGESVSISGVVLTARDCAHKRLFSLLEEKKPLPFEIKDAVIFYAGPCPAKPDMISGSCGPTTAARMEGFAPALLDLGLGAIIGKGEMNEETREALKRNTAVYFAGIGGAGALYGLTVKSSKCVAFEDLMSEAVFRLEVEDFPAIVAYDCYGGSIY